MNTINPQEPNVHVLLARRPIGAPVPEDFSIVEEPTSALGYWKPRWHKH